MTSPTGVGLDNRDQLGDLVLLRAGRGGQVDLDRHAVIGLDGDALDHAEVGDRTAQLRVDHLGQCSTDRGLQLGGRFGHHR